LLRVGFAYKGIAFPVLWKVLATGEENGSGGKEGASSTAERKELFERFLELVPPEKIRAFVADREFISEEWLGFLTEREVPFVIRIRSNRKVALSKSDEAALPVRMFFREPLLSVEGQKRRLSGDRQHFVGGQPVTVTGKRLVKEEDELLIVISSGLSACELSACEKPLRPVPPKMGNRVAFCGDEVARVQLGDRAHVTTPERIAKLVGLLALAFV